MRTDYFVLHSRIESIVFWRSCCRRPMSLAPEIIVDPIRIINPITTPMIANFVLLFVRFISCPRLLLFLIY